MHNSEFPLPARIPEPGFYYHYKHNPIGTVNNYAYEVIETGTNTENYELLVIYRSLYTEEGRGGANYWLRPLEMWFQMVEKEGIKISRFTKIIDEEVIKKLQEISRDIY